MFAALSATRTSMQRRLTGSRSISVRLLCPYARNTGAHEISFISPTISHTSPTAKLSAYPGANQFGSGQLELLDADLPAGLRSQPQGDQGAGPGAARRARVGGGDRPGAGVERHVPVAEGHVVAPAAGDLGRGDRVRVPEVGGP